MPEYSKDHFINRVTKTSQTFSHHSRTAIAILELVRPFDHMMTVASVLGDAPQ